MIPETEFVTSVVATCDDEALERVRRAARDSSRLRARLCLHPSSTESLHEMVIVMCRGTQIPIHRHRDKAECYHVISGQLTLQIHDDSGKIVETIPLGPPGTGRVFACRIASGLWHSMVVESEEAAIHESTTGPFVPEATEYLE
jgi:cupin fold WbuC family metalloprotein